jgi:hypothetical protein
LDTGFDFLVLFRILDVRFFRAMISSSYGWLLLYAGGTSSSNELPDEGNERDHEQQVDEPTGDVEDDEAEQTGYEQNHR